MRVRSWLLACLWSGTLALALCEGGRARGDEPATPSATSPESSPPVAVAEAASAPEHASVDYRRDVLPLLQRKCLACHNATEAAADVVLETHAQLAGGDEPLVVPGDPAASKLWLVASRQAEPAMPPEDNDVGAESLSEAEIALLTRWIAAGAPAGDASVSPPTPQRRWRLAPAERQPVAAVQMAAAWNQGIVAQGHALRAYDLTSGAQVQRLVDPGLAEYDPQFAEAAHLDVIGALALSADGQWLASGGYRTVKLWRRTRSKTPVTADVSAATAAAADPTGRWLAVGDADGALSLTGLQPGAGEAPRAPWPAHAAAILALQFSEDGRHLTSAAGDGSIRRWDVAEGRLSAGWQTRGPVRVVALRGDHWAATAGDDLAIRVWRLSTAGAAETAAPSPETAETAAPADAPLEPLCELAGHGRRVTCLKWQAAGEDVRLWSGGEDGFVRQWSVQETRELRHWILGEAVVAVAASLSGDQWTAVGADGKLRHGTTADAVHAWEQTADFVSARRQAQAEQDRLLAEGNLSAARAALEAADKQMQTDAELRAKAQQRLAETQVELEQKRAAADEAAARQASSADAGSEDERQTLAAAAEEARKAAEAATQRHREAQDGLRRAEEGERNAQVVRAAAEQRLAEATAVAAERERVLHESRTPNDAARILAAAFSPDANRVAVVDDGGRLLLWDAAGGVPLDAWQTSAAHAALVRFLPQGGLLAGDSETPEHLCRWSLDATWQWDRTLGSPQDPASVLTGRVLALDFSPDQRWLAIGGGEPSRSGQVVLWDMAEDRPWMPAERPHSDVVLDVAFSRDGQYLATASADREAKALRVADGQWLRTFEGHGHHVLGVAWRATGLQLATCSADKTIKVWDFLTGEQLRTLTGPSKEATAVEYLGAGEQLLVAAGDQALRVYNADDGALVRTIGVAGDYLLSCDASEAGDLAVVGGAQRIARVVSTSDGQERCKLGSADAAASAAAVAP